MSASPASSLIASTLLYSPDTRSSRPSPVAAEIINTSFFPFPSFLEATLISLRSSKRSDLLIIMTKFIKKPLVIEAFKFYVDNIPDWFMDKVSSNDIILKNCDYNIEGLILFSHFCHLKVSSYPVVQPQKVLLSMIRRFPALHRF